VNKFLNQVYLFNQLGGCPQDQTYKNMIGGLELIEEESREMDETFMQFLKDGKWTEENRADFLDSLVDLLVVTIGAGYRAGLNRQQIELAMDVVAEANLAKYPSNYTDAVKSVEQYRGDDRYTNVHMERVAIDGLEEYYVILGETEKGTRKILKGIDHKDPKDKLIDIIKGESV